MVTIPKRNTSALTFAGFEPGYPAIGAWSDYFGQQIFQGYIGASSPWYGGDGDPLGWLGYGYFNDDIYVGAKLVVDLGGPSYSAQAIGDNSTTAVGRKDGLAVFTLVTSDGTNTHFYASVLSAPDNALTETAELISYSVTDTVLAKTSFAVGAYPDYQAFKFNAAGDISLFAANAYIISDVNKVTVAVFDGATFTQYNAFQFVDPNPGYAIVYGSLILGDKYSGTTHTSILQYRTIGGASLYSVVWEPEIYVNGFDGTFASGLTQFDFDDAAFNDITNLLYWRPIDFGNANPYGFYSTNYAGDNYIIVIAKDFSWYDVYTIAGGDVISDRIFTDYIAGNYEVSFSYNLATEMIIVESGPGDVLQYASAFLSFAAPEVSRNKYRFRIPLECSDYCIPLMKKRKV